MNRILTVNLPLTLLYLAIATAYDRPLRSEVSKHRRIDPLFYKVKKEFINSPPTPPLVKTVDGTYPTNHEFKNLT